MKNWPDGTTPATIFDWIADMSPAEHETKAQVIDFRREEIERIAGATPNPFEDAAARKRKTGDARVPSLIYEERKERRKREQHLKKVRERAARRKKIESFDQKQQDYLNNLAVREELARHQKIIDKVDEKLLINKAASAGLGYGEEQALTMDMLLDAEHSRTKPTEDSDIAGLVLDPGIMFEQYRGDFGGLHTHCSLHFEEDPYTVTPRKNRF